MTEILLKSESQIDKKKLDFIIFFLKSWDIDLEVKNVKTETDSEKDIFAEVRGIWVNRDIDAKTLRKQAWNITND